MADVHCVFHLVLSAAGPGLELVAVDGVLNLDIHHDDVTLEERNGRSVDLGTEVPPCERFSFLDSDRSVVVIDGNWPVVQVHIDVIRVQCRREGLKSGVIGDREGSSALVSDRDARRLLLSETHLRCVFVSESLACLLVPSRC